MRPMKHKPIYRWSVAIVTVALISGGGLAYAHSGATGIVKQRMDMMKGMGATMKVIAGMLRGKSPYDAERVRQLATEMQEHAGHIPMMFPEGTEKAPSEAKTTIWSDPEGFAKSAKALGDYAGTLATNASDQNIAKAAFREIGQTCKSCHTDYRVKK